MFTHFTIEPNLNLPSVYPGTWNNLKKELDSTYKKFKEHHNTHTSAVQVDHILVKLITSINVPLHLNPERYYLIVQSVYREVAEVLGLGTDRQSARPNENLSIKSRLYKHAGIEIGIAYDNMPLPVNAYKNWRDLEPLKILTHKSTNIYPKILELADYNERHPYIVYSINVPLLMLQYKGWYDNEMINRTVNGVSSMNITNFIKMYPITNAAKSHINLSLIECLYKAAKNEEFIRKDNVLDTADYSIGIVNCNASLDAYAKSATKQLLKVPMTFNGIMYNCMTLDGNAWQSWLLPPIAPIGQSAWPLAIVTLNYLRILLSLSKANIRNSNAPIIEKIKREYRLLNVERNWKTHLPAPIYEYLMHEKELVMPQLY